MSGHRTDVSGHYAGAVTRFLAHSVDLAVAGFLFLVGSALFDYALRSVAGIEITIDRPQAARAVVIAVWAFLYWWVPIAVAGKTPGKALLGLRVLSRDGTVLWAGRAALRAMALPLSYLLFGIGFLGIVFGGERRALHDVIAGSVVVYDWGDRRAELPTPLTAYLEKRSIEVASRD